MSRKTTRSRPSSAARPKAAATDPCSRYALDVVEGRVVAGELVRLACQRHLDDLRDGMKRGLWFDTSAAQLAYDFFGLLKHSKGRWAGQPFVLEPWQCFFVGSIFGWKRADGSRRFRFAHLEVARKNGKTTLAAGIGLLLFLLDNEPGAEVYTVATKMDQARLTHGEAKRMVRRSPALTRHVQVLRDNLSVEATDAKYAPLGADASTLDGLNPSGAICDELHAWKLRELWDVIETATGARRQPLIVSTTTAGVGRENIWWERRELGVRVLKGLIDPGGEVAADAVFALIFTLDEDDDWTVETNWAKANPSLGVSLAVEELREKCADAVAVPGKQNAFKRLRLNVPTNQVDLWLDLARWDRCNGPADWESLKGRECFGGLDLSATTDMTSLAWVFPPVAKDEPWKALLRYWLPGDGLAERCRRDHVPYDVWSTQDLTGLPGQKLLELIDGDVIEDSVIEARVVEDARRFRVQQVAFDRWLATRLTTRLKDHHGLPMLEFGQGYASMQAPCRELEVLVTSARLAHGGHPVLRFNVSCAAVKLDPAGNRKPDKAKSTGRIDGLVAVLMGIGAAMPAVESVYNERGLLELGGGGDQRRVAETRSNTPDDWRDDED